MTWAAPKTNWSTDDGVGTTDLNRIEGNTLALRTKGSPDVASAQNISLPGNYNYYHITGATKIERIDKTGWTAGSVVFLTFAGSTLIHPGTGDSGDYIGIDAYDYNWQPGEFMTTAGCFYVALFTGTAWVIRAT